MPRTSVRRTKIVATLGPAWEDPAAMTSLIDAGVNVVRINASHGTPEIRARWIERLRSVMAPRNDALAILLDLQGPRIRVGTLAEPLRLVTGRRVVFAPEIEASAGEIPTTYDGLAGDVGPGARILLDDGNRRAAAIDRDDVREQPFRGDGRKAGSPRRCPRNIGSPTTRSISAAAKDRR